VEATSTRTTSPSGSACRASVLSAGVAKCVGDQVVEHALQLGRVYQHGVHAAGPRQPYY
jgi:hypothetical protein